jgi:replicative DNA helicase
LDALTDGFKKGDYITIAAPSSTGKTTTMIQLTDSMADEFDYPTVVISAESPTEQLHYRWLAYKTRIDLRRLKYGDITESEFEAVSRATGELMERNIFINGSPGISVSQIRREVRKVAEAKGGVGCIWVDNSLSVAQPYPGNDNQSIAEISRQLSKMRREFNCTLLNLMQLNNNWIGRNEKRPITGDLYAGGSVTRDSDLILMLYRPELYEDNVPRGTTEFICRKARDGAQGTVTLGYEPSIMRFSEIGPVRVQAPTAVSSLTEEDLPPEKKYYQKKESKQDYSNVNYF